MPVPQGGPLEACGFEFYYHGYVLVSLSFTHFLTYWLFLLLSLFFILGSVCSVFNSYKSRCFSELLTRIRVAQHEQAFILERPTAPTLRTLLLFPNLRFFLSLSLLLSSQIKISSFRGEMLLKASIRNHFRGCIFFELFLPH